jgi:hypothetical protein
MGKSSSNSTSPPVLGTARPERLHVGAIQVEERGRTSVVCLRIMCWVSRRPGMVVDTSVDGTTKSQRLHPSGVPSRPIRPAEGFISLCEQEQRDSTWTTGIGSLTVDGRTRPAGWWAFLGQDMGASGCMSLVSGHTVALHTGFVILSDQSSRLSNQSATQNPLFRWIRYSTPAVDFLA